MAAHFAHLRARQAQQAAIVALGEPGLVDLRGVFVAVVGFKGGGEQFVQADVALLVAYQQHGTVGLFRLLGVFYAHVCAANGLDACFATGFVEFEQPKGVHQVGERKGGIIFGAGGGNVVSNADDAVGDGEFGVGTKGDGGHFQAAWGRGWNGWDFSM